MLKKKERKKKLSEAIQNLYYQFYIQTDFVTCDCDNVELKKKSHVYEYKINFDWIGPEKKI